MFRSKLLIFKVGKSKYACNIKDVDRIIKYENLTYVPSKQVSFEGFYNHEGRVIKIFNMSKRLGVEYDTSVKNTNRKIIIVKDGNVLVGIVVDEVLEVFNYGDQNSKITDDEEKLNTVKDKDKYINLHYVKDMILLNGEIVIYISITKIIAIELEESDL